MFDDLRASSGNSRIHCAPYEGSRRKLILAFDIGTTFSGVSYTQVPITRFSSVFLKTSFRVLDPGQIPVIKGVTQFPAHEVTSTSCKIPTIIYYDEVGQVRAVGAEATQDGMYERAEEENWTKAEWFKLHLRSKVGDSINLVEAIPALPRGKTIVEVMADFLVYLLECTATFLQDTQPNGEDMWESFRSATLSPSTASNDGIDFVLSHPNGWEGKEQAQMREAVIRARLVPDTPEGQTRIRFVTEGEASLHFVVRNGLLPHVSENEGIVVVDAGGGTIDISTYKRQASPQKISFEEIAAARCYLYGSVFVTIAAREFLQETLSESCYIEDLEHITACFDKTTKLRFENDRDPYYIKFGGRSDNDPHVNIRFGQMKLAGTDIAEFFRPSIECVIQAVMEQKTGNRQSIHASPKTGYPSGSPLTLYFNQHVVLVGGFSASARLFHKVKDVLTARGMTVIRPENNVVKAVSDGAISFYLDHYINTRVAKVTYGTPIAVRLRPNNPDHQQRVHQAVGSPEGGRELPGVFQIILTKGTQVKEDMEFSHSFRQCTRLPTTSRTIEEQIFCYRGAKEPYWMDEDPSNYSMVFKLLATVPFRRHLSPGGTWFYQANLDVVILFGLTEIQAYLRWEEDGEMKKSPAKIIYD